MHWLLLLGGEAWRPSGTLIHRTTLQHCSPQQLGDTIDQSMQNLYSFPEGLEPPSPYLQTWALGLQIQDQRQIEHKLLPEMKHRLERLGISWKYDAFYEDAPEGSRTFNLLSREKSMTWLQSIADHLMDSKIENEIVLYEFSDRPAGFPKPDLPEVSRPWYRANVAIFRNGLDIQGPAGPTRLAPKLPPANPAGAFSPGQLGDATATDDGAGPSRNGNPAISPKLPNNIPESVLSPKIAGIRAALERNGYPPDVIEDMIQNNFTTTYPKNKNSLEWRVKLPNGNVVRSYPAIEAHPYSKENGSTLHVLQNSEKVRPLSTPATVADDGAGPSRAIDNVKIKQNHVNRTRRGKLIARIRASLEYNGYPPDVIEDLIQHRLQVQLHGAKQYSWTLVLYNGKHVMNSFGIIDAYPYPGGKITEKSARKCPDCNKPFGHRGRCVFDEFADALKAENINQLTSGVRKALEYAGYPYELIQQMVKNDFSIVQDPQARGKLHAWSLKLPDGQIVSTYKDISKNPYPGGKVDVNPICHTVDCGKEFGHKGPCRDSLTALVQPILRPPQQLLDNSIKATLAANGAGPSRLANPVEGDHNRISNSEKEALKALKIAGIRAALQQNGYPLDVIENLIQNKLSLYLDSGKSFYRWRLQLSNGKLLRSYLDIKANPYPGVKVTSNPLCHTLGCAQNFGHKGPCSNGAGSSRPSNPVEGDQSHINSSEIEGKKAVKIAGIRDVLQRNGYPSDVIEDLIQNKLHMRLASKQSFFHWRLFLPDGTYVRSYPDIEANPYSGGKITGKSTAAGRSRRKNNIRKFGAANFSESNKVAAGKKRPRQPSNSEKEESDTGLDDVLHPWYQEDVHLEDYVEDRQRDVRQQNGDGAGDGAGGGGIVDNGDHNSGEAVCSEDDESLEDYGGSLGFSDSMQDCCSEEEEEQQQNNFNGGTSHPKKSPGGKKLLPVNLEG